ncbi:MAG TPA: hypothetical protein VL990_10600 [Acidobacteriaceae bacterium]|nr:hypothetical protein [Acidobacteriaceae bacterium]
MTIFDFLFGCRHADLSRVFTIGGQTYRVCIACGSRFSYSLASMRMGRRFIEAPEPLPAQPAQSPRRVFA